MAIFKTIPSSEFATRGGATSPAPGATVPAYTSGGMGYWNPPLATLTPPRTNIAAPPGHEAELDRFNEIYQLLLEQHKRQRAERATAQTPAGPSLEEQLLAALGEDWEAE